MSAPALKPFKAACVQFNPQLNCSEDNVAALLRVVEEAAREGARLIVTPEMATTGYHYRDREAIRPFVDTIPGRTTERFAEICRLYDTYIVLSMPEADAKTDLYYISAALIGPDGVIGTYRKTHLWECEARWAAAGDLGIPVFATHIGNIAITICMDSVYYETARSAALGGADILAFPTNSSSQSIAVLQARAEANGLYVASANRSNKELGFHMVGGSAVWSPLGTKLAEAEVMACPDRVCDEPAIVYAEIDPSLYRNPAKERLKERRSGLYKDIMLSHSPWDERRNRQPRQVRAVLAQYEPVPGDKQANVRKMLQFIPDRADPGQAAADLVVFPELSVTGPVDSLTPETIRDISEHIDGDSVALFRRAARERQTHLVFGFVEREGDRLYNSAVLIDDAGEVAGTYRKTHLQADERRWAHPGDRIAVFSTEKLGSIGVMIGYDAAFPEVAGVLAAQRADMIAIPSSWRRQFSCALATDPLLTRHPYPDGAVTAWAGIAVGAQAYTLAANYVGTAAPYGGRSAMYTLDPFYGLDRPIIASAHGEEAVSVAFTTIQPDWWFNQQKLLDSRKPHHYTIMIVK